MRPHHRACHAERTKDVFLHVLGERSARRLLDDHRRESECGVVVIPLHAGRVLQRGLGLYDLNDLIATDVVTVIDPAAGHHKEIEDLPKPRGVREQVPDGDQLPEIWQLECVLRAKGLLEL